jgi:CARDB protein
MRRVAPILCLIALAGPATALAQAPPLRARLVACTTGPQPAQRTAAYLGSMPSFPGVRRMAMRFDLLARQPPSPDFVPIAVPLLGVWLRSHVNRSGFIFTQRVQALVAPGSYRAVVRFRWYGSGHRLLRSRRRLTAVCRQPDWRPNLHAGALTMTPGATPDLATYRLVVRNTGRGDAGPFDVALSLGPTPLVARVAAGLPAGGRTSVEVTAPPCAPGSTLVLTLDAHGEVSESREGDDIVVRSCPAVA